MDHSRSAELRHHALGLEAELAGEVSMGVRR